MSWLKVAAISVLGALSTLGPITAAQAAPGYPAPPAITGTTAVVLDANSGQVLWQKNAHQRRPMASTTKLMTSLLAIESGRLDETVTISKHAAAVGESTIYLKEGEKLKLRELLYGVLLSSANDASMAVAEYLGGGSEPRFIEMMNRRAQELGLVDTHFSNPHGLPIDNHYSSAYDLARLLQEDERHPDWCQIAETKFKTIPGLGKPNGRVLRNHNRLLWAYPFATGGKTGYTNAAGRCFVGSARKNGRVVVQTVMNAKNMWGDSQKLLMYGVDNFENVIVAKKGEVVGTVPIQSGNNRVVEVVAPRDVMVCLPRGAVDKASLQQVWQLPDTLTAPIDENQQVGQLIVRQNGKVLATVPLVAAQAVPVAASPWQHVSSWFFPGMLAASVLSLFRLQGVRRRRKVVKRRVARRPAPAVPVAGQPAAKRGLTGRLFKAS